MRKLINLAAAAGVFAAVAAPADAARIYNRLPKGTITVCAGAIGSECDSVGAGGRSASVSHSAAWNLTMCPGTSSCTANSTICDLGKVGLSGGDVMVVTSEESGSEVKIHCNAYHASAITNGRITGSAYASETNTYEKNAGKWEAGTEIGLDLLQSFIEAISEGGE